MINHLRGLTPSRSRSLLALVCALVSGSVQGCGGAPSAHRDPSELRSFDIVSLLPHDAEAVVVIDVATLRRAPFMAHVTEALQPVLEGMYEDMWALMDRTDRFALALRHEPAADGNEPLLVVAQGRFSNADLETFGASLQQGTHREHALRRDGPTVLALAYDHTLMFGSDHLVMAALDRLDGGSPLGGPDSPVMLDAMHRAQIGRHTITFASAVSNGFRSSELEEFPMRANAVSWGAWVDVADPLHLQGFALFDDEAAAAALATAVREKITEGQQSPELAAAGFENLFTSAQIVTNGTVVDVTYSVDNATFERVIAAAMNGFMAFQSAAATAAEEEPAPTEGQPNFQP